jgi:hypothetical protein
VSDRPCPCGHGPDLACLNGKIYGPCGNESCDTPCDDNYGRCKTLDGCCDPESNVGRVLSSTDPEPPTDTLVRDDLGQTWINSGYYPAAWMCTSRDDDVETWTKIAGNYGPVTVLEWGDDE